MAADTCWGQTKTFSACLGKNNPRSVGFRFDKKWLQTRIYSETSFFGNNRDQGQSRQPFSNSYRNSKSFRQKRYRNSSKTSNSLRFLQYVIPRSEKERRIATCNKPKTPKQVSAEKTFQNGQHEESVKFSSKRRLVHKSRLKRCLFSHRDFQRPSSFSSVLFPVSCVSVQSNVLRSDCGTSSFLQSNCCSSSPFASTRNSSCNLLGRLASSKQCTISASKKSNSSLKSPFRTRFYCKQEKIMPCTSSNSDLYRGSFHVKRGDCLSNKRKGSQFTKSSSPNITGSGHSQTISCSVGNDSVLHRSDSQCKVVHEAYSASSIAKLESQENVSLIHDSIYTFFDSSFALVATGSEHSEGLLFSIQPFKCYTDHRCKQYMGLGWSYEQPYCARPLVSNRMSESYQLPGDGGDNSFSQTFSASPKKQVSFDSNRLEHMCSIYQSPRGHKIVDTLSNDLGFVDVSFEQQNKFEGSPHFGKDKCFSRSSEQGMCEGYRVVPEQNSCDITIQSLGSSSDGFVCNIRKQENTTVLLMDSSPSSICHGCPVNCMAEHVCLCVPSNSVVTTCSVTSSTIQLHSDSDCTKLAKATLVPSSITITDSKSTSTTIAVGLSVSSKGQDFSFKSSHSQSDCMAHIDRCLETEGFSEKSRKLLASSWRKGTQKDYMCKFRLFCSWCREQQIDPYAASLKDCVNFLSYKFHQGTAYRTISGYRSMFSAVLSKVDNVPVGQHPYVIRLLRGVFNERPPVKKLVPEWDLLFVLGSLKEAPYEPLRKASLKYLTWKTCFLIAVTSFRRCSDLQALRLGESFVNVQKKGITFIRPGLSKQDRPNHKPTPIFIPSFPGNKRLDPKRCLAFYLKRTEKFRNKSGQDITKLFLSSKKPHQPVSSQTISTWIVNTIKQAYLNSDRSVKSIKGHSTRSLGPSWALFKGVSMKDIMESADWSRETTFVKHYLADMNINFLDV